MQFYGYVPGMGGNRIFFESIRNEGANKQSLSRSRTRWGNQSREGVQKRL